MRVLIVFVVLVWSFTANTEPSPLPTPVSVATWTRPPCEGGVAVQHGDVNYGVIAERVFGDAKRWREIAIANPEVDPTKLKVGQCLFLRANPSVARILGVALALLIREEIDRPVVEVNSGPTPQFSQLFGQALAVCINQASVGLSPEDINGLDDVCFMRLSDVWRLATTSPTVSTPHSSPPSSQ